MSSSSSEKHSPSERTRRDVGDGTGADGLRPASRPARSRGHERGWSPRARAGSVRRPRRHRIRAAGAVSDRPTRRPGFHRRTRRRRRPRHTGSRPSPGARPRQSRRKSPRSHPEVVPTLLDPTDGVATHDGQEQGGPEYGDHGDDHPPPAVEQGKTATVVATRPALRGITKWPPPALRGRARGRSCGRHELGRRGRQRRAASTAEPAGRVVLLPACWASSGLDRLGSWRPTGRLWRRRRRAGGRGRRLGDAHWRDRRCGCCGCGEGRLDPDPARPNRGRCRRTHRMSTRRGCVHHRQRTGLPSPRCPRFGSVHSPQYLASLTCVQRTCGMGG